LGVGLGLGFLCGVEKDGVVFALEEDGDEPVLEVEVAGAEDAAAKGIALQVALTREHGAADGLAGGEGGVEFLDEAAGGFDEDGVAHGDDGADADVEEGGGDGAVDFGFGGGGLACFEKDEGDVEFGEGGGEVVGIDDVGSALDDFMKFGGVFEDEAAFAALFVVGSVAVEMENVIGLVAFGGGVEFGDEGVEGRGLEEGDVDEVAEGFHGGDEGFGAGAVVDVRAPVFGIVGFGAGGDEQDADGRFEEGGFAFLFVGEASADPGGLGPLEKVVVAVVEKFPWKCEEVGADGLAGGGGVLGLVEVAGFYFDRESAGSGRVAGPSFEGGAGFVGGESGLVEGLAPRLDGGFDAFGAGAEGGAGPDGVGFEIPAEIVEGNEAQRIGEDEGFGGDAANGRVGGNVGESGCGAGARGGFFGACEAGEAQQEFGVASGLGLGRAVLARTSRWQLNAKSIQDFGQCILRSCLIGSDWNEDRIGSEKCLGHAEFGAVERKRDDRLVVFFRVEDLLGDPVRLQRLGRHEEQERIVTLDARLDFGGEIVAANHFPVVYPDLDATGTQ